MDKEVKRKMSADQYLLSLHKSGDIVDLLSLNDSNVARYFNLYDDHSDLERREPGGWFCVGVEVSPFYKKQIEEMLYVMDKTGYEIHTVFCGKEKIGVSMPDVVQHIAEHRGLHTIFFRKQHKVKTSQPEVPAFQKIEQMRDIDTSGDFHHVDGIPKYRVAAVLFRTDHKSKAHEWGLMKRALFNSLKKNTRDVEINIYEMKAPQTRSPIRYGYVANNAKLKVWINEALNSDLPVVLLDIDMIVVRDLYEIFELDFDIAVTERPTRAWNNGGAIYIKPTERAKEFIRAWVAYDTELLNSGAENRPPALHAAQTRTRHMGMNQPSLVDILQRGSDYETIRDSAMIDVNGCKILKVPCQVWNNCDHTWHQFDEKTRVIHTKSNLRSMILRGKIHSRKLRENELLINTIREYYD